MAAMKLVAASFLLVAGFGVWFAFSDWRDPRSEGPAAIPERYLTMARDECVAGLTAAGQDGKTAESFCGCVTAEVGRRVTFRDFRKARVELEQARADSGTPQSFSEVLLGHRVLGPIIETCRAQFAERIGD